MERDPDHEIIDRPHEYRIADLRYSAGLDGEEAFVDLELRKESTVRRLRFWSPQQFEIEPGFPLPTHGMLILDVRRRRLEGCHSRRKPGVIDTVCGATCTWIGNDTRSGRGEQPDDFG